MSLENIREIVLIGVGAVFAGLAVFGILPPVGEEVVVTLVELIFSILGSLGIGIGGAAMILKPKQAEVAELKAELSNLKSRG